MSSTPPLTLQPENWDIHEIYHKLDGEKIGFAYVLKSASPVSLENLEFVICSPFPPPPAGVGSGLKTSPAPVETSSTPVRAPGETVSTLVRVPTPRDFSENSCVSPSPSESSETSGVRTISKIPENISSSSGKSSETPVRASSESSEVFVRSTSETSTQAMVSSDLSVSSVSVTMEDSKEPIEDKDTEETSGFDHVYHMDVDDEPENRRKTIQEASSSDAVHKKTVTLLNLPAEENWLRECVGKEGDVTKVFYLTPPDKRGKRKRVAKLKTCMKEIGADSQLKPYNFSFSKQVLGLSPGFEIYRTTRGVEGFQPRLFKKYFKTSEELSSRNGKKMAQCMLCEKTTSYRMIVDHMAKYHLPDEICPHCSQEIPAAQISDHIRSCAGFGNSLVQNFSLGEQNSVESENTNETTDYKLNTAAVVQEENLLGDINQSHSKPSTTYINTNAFEPEEPSSNTTNDVSVPEPSSDFLTIAQNELIMSSDLHTSSPTLHEQEYLSLSPCTRLSATRQETGFDEEDTSQTFSAEPVKQVFPIQTDNDRQVNRPLCHEESAGLPSTSDDHNNNAEDVADDRPMTKVTDCDNAKEVVSKCLLDFTPESGSLGGLDTSLPQSPHQTHKTNPPTKFFPKSDIPGLDHSTTFLQPPTDAHSSPVQVTLVCSDPLFKAKLQTQSNKPLSKVIKKFAKMLGLSPSSLTCKVDNVRLTGQELTGNMAGAVINVERKGRTVVM